MHTASPSPRTRRRHRGLVPPLVTCLAWAAATGAAPAQAGSGATQESAAASLRLPAFVGYAHPDPTRMHRRDDGSVERCEGALAFYVHLTQQGELELTLHRGAVPGGELVVTVGPHTVELPPRSDVFVQASPAPLGHPRTTTTRLPSLKSAAEDRIGTFRIHSPGHHRIELRFADGAPLRKLHALTLSGPAAAGAHANLKERRNAASVHLGYPVPEPERESVAWFYVEMTPRTDPLWSYYMATGWDRGYFGMQVNSSTERRLIFSVWDAGGEPTDRDKVATADRVTLVAKGEGVVADRFGNEGTGGHSHLVHDWKLGQTYRFLVHAAPDGTHTTYSGWFWFAAERRWGLIASFRAPKDGRYLHGLYSFSENFAGENGDALRECAYGRLWIGTAAGSWLPLDEAHFTHDPTGDHDRLDRCAFAELSRFVLRHGGFVATHGCVTRAHTRLRLSSDRDRQRPECLAVLPTPPAAVAPPQAK